MLANRPNYRSKSRFLLPVIPIVQTVEQHDCDVTTLEVVVAEELNENLFQPKESVLIISDLGDEKTTL